MSQFPNQDRTTVKSGKSIDEAIETALAELEAARGDVEIEIMQEPSKGFLGFGGKPALVKVTAKAAEAPVSEPEPVKEPAAAQDASAAAPRQSRPRNNNQRNRNRRRNNNQRKNRDREAAAAEVTGDVKPYVPTTLPIPSKEDEPVEAARIFLTSMFAAMDIAVKKLSPCQKAAWNGI